MTTRRAVTYGGLFCLLAAWLASAASTTFVQQDLREPERSMPGPSPDAIASEVQEHAARLRQRLATAPVPQPPHRNPFMFESRSQAPPRSIARRLEPVALPEPLPVPEPLLSLIGIAEDQGLKGVARTAIIADDAETVFMVTVGQTVLGRYRVEAIGADAVELKDVDTSVIRRLALR